jgi:hypothetical protein
LIRVIAERTHRLERKERKMMGRRHAPPRRATPCGSSPVPAVSFQPLLDLLASKHASEDSEDATFDGVAGSVLAEYAERRDELEEWHERHDLVSSHCPFLLHTISLC